MAIREKLKAKFSSKNKSSGASSPPPSETPVEGHYTGRTDIEYYKPHEIPKSKYRGKVDKAHQEKLDSFTFRDSFAAFTRRSSMALSGTFSPGGTKAFSRRPSYVSGAQTPARSRRSSLSSDANASFSIPSSESDSTHMRSIAATMTPSDPVLNENVEQDADPADTDLSKYDTVKADNVPTIRLDREATVTDKGTGITNAHIEQASGQMPFSPEELTQAMTRATISARRTSVAVA